MRNESLFKNIKVAIFDFDDTLALHKDKTYLNRRNEDEEYRLNYFLNAYLNPVSFYETIEPCTISKSLYELIHFFKNNKVKMYCVSGMRFSFHLKAKENFVHTHYDPDMEVISVRSQESKVEAIKIIQRLHHCKLEEILFADDAKENVVRFKEMGVYALLPNEIDSIILENE